MTFEALATSAFGNGEMMFTKSFGAFGHMLPTRIFPGFKSRTVLVSALVVLGR